MPSTDTLMAAVTGAEPPEDDFVLDVRLVEAGPDTTILLGDTDDGCDTQRPGDC